MDAKSVHRKALKLAESAFLRKVKGKEEEAVELYSEAYSLVRDAALSFDENDKALQAQLFKTAAKFAQSCGDLGAAGEMLRIGLSNEMPDELRLELESIKGELDPLIAEEKPFKVDLEKGINIRVAGELGRFHSLPIDFLVKVGQSLQHLIQSLARYELTSGFSPNLDNFRIELSGFRRGSAVPQFKLTDRVQFDLNGQDIKAQRAVVSQNFNKLLEICDSGEFMKLNDLYKRPQVKRQIVSDLFDFNNAFGNSPISIVESEQGKKTFRPLYKVRPFKRSVRDEILYSGGARPKKKEKRDEVISYARVQYPVDKSGKPSKRSTKVLEFFEDPNFAPTYHTKEIISGNNRYILKHDLYCSVDKDEKLHRIGHEMLDIYGMGESREDAVRSFHEEFDFMYQNLTQRDRESLPDSAGFIRDFLERLVLRMEAVSVL